jgi:charged multivesicular body protein 5
MKQALDKIFGRKKKEEPKAPPPDMEEVSGRMDARMGTLQEKIKAMDLELAGLKKQIKRASGAAKVRLKKRAMMVLKRRKMIDAQYGQVLNQSFNIEQTSNAIRNALDTKEHIAAMKGARDELKKFSAEMNLDEVEDLYDDMDEVLMDQEEVQEIMGRNFGNVEEVDEDELMDELEGLDSDLEDEVGESDMGFIPEANTTPLPAGGGGEAVPAETDDFGLPVPVGTR